ncbi:rhodanese-related sulfurtransferase [Symbiobacterium terraclitae]|uniref:Rhodanese-related sulfurtransferase n=1 Tax=Symbiobacterium terraclitae TaxID=557451 RepID=A0ABS4JXS5_9FIRM|nr:rhodanese-like domain-containing protein [Symbiobacterium terraclitae]MBP2019791.1 rhodanese-related sulfurtransferase [Symbiobacterium terraclitae]
MTKRMRHLVLALTLILSLAALTACGGSAQAPAAASQTSQCPECPACPEPEPVDVDAILMEEAQAYFNNMASHKNMIDAADVKAKLDAGDQSIFLLDIRNDTDFAAGHVEGSVNIPFAQLGANFDKLPKDKMIVINCYSGQTSSQATAVLRMAGYNAMSLKGGFPNYEKAELPIVK